MAKMEKHCIGEVNEIYERYCFNKRDKLPTESVDCFFTELKTLAKTRVNLLTLPKLAIFATVCVIVLSVIALYLELKMSRLPRSYWEFDILLWIGCIDICRSEEITALHMKSLLEPVDNINKVKSEKKKPRVPILDVQSGKKISCKFCGYEHAPERKKCPAWGKVCLRCKKKNHFAKG